MPKSLTISDLLSHIPKLRAQAHRRMAKLRDELAQVESEIAKLDKLGIGGVRRGRPPKASKAGRRSGARRGPKGGLKKAVAALFAANAGKTLKRADLVGAGVKAGLTPGSAQAGLTALTKAKVITTGGRGLFKAGPNVAK